MITKVGAETARMILRGISWETYERLAEELNDQSIRLTYDRGVLELMSPSHAHERFKKLFGRLVEDILVGLRIPFEAAGESRWRREAARWGLEADECYYLTAEKLAIVRGRAAEHPDDPVPDLAIEIDLERPELDRPGIYAALGVPEVWRFDGADLRIDRLRDDGTYESVDASGFLPVRAEEVADWIARASDVDFLAWIDQLQVWIRDELARRPR